MSCSRTQHYFVLPLEVIPRSVFDCFVAHGPAYYFSPVHLEAKIENFSHEHLRAQKQLIHREVAFLLTFLGKCSFSTKVILLSNDLISVVCKGSFICEEKREAKPRNEPIQPIGGREPARTLQRPWV